MAEDESGRVLVVDDSAAMRRLVCDALELEGFVTVEAASGFAAIKELAAQSFDLVVTDINMPDLTGLEVIRYCRTRPASPPVVVISTDSAAEDRRRALKLGAVDYLTKPFEPDDLVALCRRHMSHGE